MITETRERFLKNIAEHIAADRIVEGFFFPAIRQGPMETGVAVIVAIAAPVEPPVSELAIVESSPSDVTGRAEVFSATYHWTRKGIDRGKWVVQVVAEADAPLGTAETVVRGVQQRLGEALDAHRMSGDDIRAALAAPDFAPTSSAASGGAAATAAPTA